MNKKQLTDLRVKLYKATPLKLKLVDTLISTIQSCFGDKIETTSITLKKQVLKIDKLYVRQIEIDKELIGGVLIHWFPDFSISTKTDPYCSAYMLKHTEIAKIMNFVSKIANCYNK